MSTVGNGEDDLGIRATARAYLDGMVYADEAMLRGAFHAQAAVVGHSRGGLEWDTLDAFVAAVLRAGGPPLGTPYFAEIETIDRTCDIAMIRLADDYLGSRYTDYLTLLKHDGRWLIVHKAFYEHAEDA